MRALVALLVAAVLTLTLAAPAAASPECRYCIESVQVARDSAGLRIEALMRTADGAPASATAVVMAIDGRQSKCIQVALARTSDTGALVSYVGTIAGFRPDLSAVSGRVDVGGDIHEFTAPVDGSAGSVRFIAPGSAGASAVSTAIPVSGTIVRSAPAPAQAAAAPAVPAPAPVLDVPGGGALAVVAVVTLLAAVAAHTRRRSGAPA